MARQPRLEYAGAVYHVVARGNDRARIFYTLEDRHRLLGVVAEAIRRHEVLLHAYVLMDNHYHLLPSTPI